MLDRRFVQGKIIEKVTGGYLIEFQTLSLKLHRSFIREQFRVRHVQLCSSSNVNSCPKFDHPSNKKSFIWMKSLFYGASNRGFCKMNLCKFTIHSLSVIKTNRKSIELTSDINGLIDILSSAFFGEPSSCKRHFFFMNFVMMDRIISTIKGYICKSWSVQIETFEERLQILVPQNKYMTSRPQSSCIEIAPSAVYNVLCS